MMETGEKYKVVIVDDERTAIDALRRELEPYREFEVKGIAGNGAKGKKMIMELHPDLLFLDVELPDTLGLNLLSEIREDILWDMKVVFYTSYDKYLLQALRESAFDFLHGRPGMNTPVLEVTNLSKNFGGLRALNEVDLTINRQEIVALIGPNGAGKTTFFNCITGIYLPPKGPSSFTCPSATASPPAPRPSTA